MHRLRWKGHNYLVMWLYYLVPREVLIYIEDYLRGVLDYFLEEVTELPETPEATNLFNIREGNKCEPLNKKRAQSFHHAVAQ